MTVHVGLFNVGCSLGEREFRLGFEKRFLALLESGRKIGFTNNNQRLNFAMLGLCFSPICR